MTIQTMHNGRPTPTPVQLQFLQELEKAPRRCDVLAQDLGRDYEATRDMLRRLRDFGWVGVVSTVRYLVRGRPAGVWALTPVGVQALADTRRGLPEDTGDFVPERLRCPVRGCLKRKVFKDGCVEHTQRKAGQQGRVA